MEERLFKHLIVNEPGVAELTKKQYEDYRALEQSGAGSKDPEDVEPVLEEATGEKELPEVFSGTRTEAIKVLQERGFPYTQLRRLKKQELIDLL